MWDDKLLHPRSNQTFVYIVSESIYRREQRILISKRRFIWAICRSCLLVLLGVKARMDVLLGRSFNSPPPMGPTSSPPNLLFLPISPTGSGGCHSKLAPFRPLSRDFQGGIHLLRQHLLLEKYMKYRWKVYELLKRN